MSSLLAALAIPGLKSAISATRIAAASVENSFADALRTASEFCRSESASKPTDQDPSGAKAAELADDVTARLQHLFDEAGAVAGEQFEIQFADDGAMEITSDSGALDCVKDAIAADSILCADLRRLAHDRADESGGATGDTPASAITVEVA